MAITKPSNSTISTFTKYDNASAGSYPAQFLVTGPTGTILTSPDGITWTARTTGLPAFALSAVYRTGSLYAAIDGGYGNRYTSSDNGVTWTINGQAAGFNNASAQTLQKNAKFNYVDKTVNLFPNMPYQTGNWGSMFDVTNGVPIGNTAISTNNWGAWDYATNGSVFLIAGGNPSTNTTAPYLLKSTTTKSGVLTTQSYGSSSSSYSVCYGAGVFAVTDSNGTGVWTSPDGTTWTSRGQTFRYMMFAENLFIGWQGNALYTSPNAISWTARTVTGLGANGIHSVIYGAGLYVAICDAGLIFTSPDGITWTSRTSGTATSLNSIYYG